MGWNVSNFFRASWWKSLWYKATGSTPPTPPGQEAVYRGRYFYKEEQDEIREDDDAEAIAAILAALVASSHIETG